MFPFGKGFTVALDMLQAEPHVITHRALSAVAVRCA